MSFLNKMGAAVGIGAAEVSVALPQGRYHWGEAARGTAVVQGGTAEQQVTRITATVMEHWTTRDSEKHRDEHHYRHHNETQIGGAGTLAPGATGQYEFQILIPDGADLDNDWSIQVRAHVAGGADRHGATSFVLLPSAAALGLAGALEAAAPFTPSSRANRGRQVLLDFKPPEAAKRSLDGVKLIVTEDAGTVHGTLEINPQEHSFADHMKALVRADLIRHPISFPAAPLAASEGGTPPAEVVEQLRALLQPYLG